MRADTGAPAVAAPQSPPASAAGHATAGDLPEEFDFGQPFEVDIGRAAVIAEVLRECGFLLCTADVMTAELAMPQRERGMIGRFAADALERYGWRP